MVKVLPALVLFLAVPVMAQQTTPPKTDPPAPSPLADVPTVTSQLEAVGCQAERGAAAQTIVQLQKRVDDLQHQLDAKSGATKH